MANNDWQEGHPGRWRRAGLHFRSPASWAVVGIVIAGAAAAWWYLSGRAVVESEPQDEVSTPQAAAERSAYLGMQACAACHAERVAEFRSTRHCLACCPPDPATMPAAFSSTGAVYAPRDAAVRFEMSRSGDEFFQTAILTTPKGEQRTQSRIDLVYGAGAGTDEVYLTWHGDRLYELPIAWLHPQETWGANSFDPNGSGDFSRELTPRCLECHNTWFEHSPGTLNQYKRDTAILGVTCEKCHGPGRDHVAFHEGHPDARTGEAIVSPNRLTRELQLDLCAQCHSNALTYRGPAFGYRPGTPLDSYFRTIHPRYPEEDHVANQVQYLRQSKCFQQSGALTCTTCHNPHQPRSPTAGAGQSACLNCHQTADCGERQRLPAAVQDNCVGCHMPAADKIQVHFRIKDEKYVSPVKRWEHRIAVYPASAQEVLMAWYRTQTDDLSRAEADRLAALLNEHWLSEAENRRREYRFLAAVYAYRQALRLHPSAATRAKLDEVMNSKSEAINEWNLAVRVLREGRPAEAIETFERLLSIQPDYAKAHGKLGAAYAATGQRELAVKHLQTAARCDPDDPYGPGMLGWLAYLDGKPEQALEHYRHAEELEPYNAQVKYQIGLSLLKLSRWPDAEDCFRQALKINPNHAGACQALSHALRQQGETAEALHFAQEAARLTQFGNVDVLVTLAEAYADAGRLDEAGETAAKALAASQTGKIKISPEIRARLEALHDRARQAAPPSK